MSDRSDNTEEPTSQSDEVDVRLAHARGKENIRERIHVQSEVNNPQGIRPCRPPKNRSPALLDSGATENFMSLAYAKWLKTTVQTSPLRTTPT